MPGTAWSAPMQNLAQSSLTTSSFTTATLTDISPSQCLLPPGSLNLGTRVRITATGTYAASTTASTITWQLNMNQAGTVIGTTPAILTISPAITAVVVTGGEWILQYWGRMAAVSTTTGTTASIVGHGLLTTVASGGSLTAALTVYPMPVTLAGATVAQTATGLITYTEQNIMVGATIATNTGLTNIITDELTCELLG
jgi:hypothetical protein